MTTSILGIGTASPIHCSSQEEGLQMFTDIVCENDRQRRLARALFRKSHVKNRHFVISYKAAYAWCQPAELSTAGAMSSSSLSAMVTAPEQLPEVIAGASAGPTTSERMQMYAHFASDLAMEASSNALENAGAKAAEITHLVTVTCTGFDSPGVDLELIRRLGLADSTQRINVGFMGCHGAINGLRAALAISKSDPQARVLLCCVELCSLHYRFQWDNEGVIGNALFADGSAALVIGQPEKPSAAENEPWQLLDTGSVVIPDSQDSMSWKIGNHGFEMLLGNDVGDKIEASLSHWLTEWLSKYQLTLDDIAFWGVHPGGPRILSAVESSLNFAGDQLATSRAVLSQFGNMSSPTVLFILQEFQRQQRQAVEKKQGHCLLLAFGPGLVAEAALVRV